MEVLPVLLSGGSGSRLWPVSRKAFPKPFVKLPDGETLIHKTYLRAAELPNAKGLLTITNSDYYYMSKDELDFIKQSHPYLETAFLLEPVGRNTAPAIAMAALMAAEQYGPDTIMLVLSADHIIENKEQFEQTVSFATNLANDGHLVTFGIKPHKPETGYGYIETGKELASSSENNLSAHRVKQFVEKPSLETAEQYLQAGRYLWNSGMFCFRADTILNALQQYSPDVHSAALACFSASQNNESYDANVMRLDLSSFQEVPDISIDYAIMEKAEDVVVVPSDFGWSDVGCWQSMGDMIEADEAGNRIDGEVVVVDVENTLIQSKQRLIAGVGLKNLVVIDTEDALLIADKDRVQDVKQVVEHLRSSGHDAAHLHRTVVRPWGTYTILEEGERFKIKRIVVKAGASLSLQMHYHRSEHWVVVSGSAKIVNGDEEILLKQNESTFIPAGHKHRLENPGKMDMVLIEVQSGEYLGEDDIVRFDDVYGRC